MKTLNYFINKLEEAVKLVKTTTPEFKNKEGKWVHDNQHLITVIHMNTEIEKPRLDYPYLIGIYKTDKLEKANEFWLYPDAIKYYSEKYSAEGSIIIEKGKIVGDLRKTMGAAMTAEPTGLSESDAFNYFETLCKIQLTIFNIIDCKYGKWKCEFYSSDNIDFIDQLVNQLTKQVINEDSRLVDCFEWLNINYLVKNTNILFNDSIALIKHMPGTDKQEWNKIKELDIFFNCFPILEKNNTETWETFFNRCKEKVQDCLIGLAKKENRGWLIIDKYLNEENKNKHRGVISGKKFDF